MKGVARRADQVTVSLIRKMYDLGNATPGAVSLAVGEPDFPTPPHIVEAGQRALAEGWTRYSPNPGYLELREAIADKLDRVNGLKVDPGTEVFVTVGAMEALMLTFMVTLDPGDEVILTDPGYCNYASQLQLAGARPVFVTCDPERGYLPDAAALEAAITPRTRLVLLNSPGNPTGAVYPRDLLHTIADVVRRHDLLLLSDEAYEALVYGDIRHVSPGAFPELAGRAVSIYSFSKEYAMTGWRVGYLTGPAAILKPMANIQEQMASCVNAAAQRAALAALRGPQDCVETMRQAYQRRRDLVVKRLNAMPGVRCPRPDGAFYAFPDVRAITSDTTGLCERLLSRHKVVVSPGEAFGPSSAGFFRLSYASSDAQLHEGLRRLEAGLAEEAAG